MPRFKKKSLKPSSKRWLQRQFNDEYVRRAKVEGYRSRSAYKLLEIQKGFQLMKPGHTVVDLGCSPGSWTQIAVRSTNATDIESRSLIIGLDIKHTEPIPGAFLINGLDFEQNDSHIPVLKALRNRQVNVLLSDMAPNMTGIGFVDQHRMASLCFAALEVVQRICVKGASLVMKVFDSPETKKIMSDARELFHFVRVFHPKAIRRPSSEMYYIGLRYKGNRLLIPDYWNERLELE